MAAAAPYAIMGLAGAIKGAGEARGMAFEAEKAKRAGQIAKLQADQVDAQYREELSSTISNIRAIRAATGSSADSPSARAYIAEEERVSSRERRIKAGGLRMQGRQYDSDARFMRSSARWSLGLGVIGGLTSAYARG